LIFNRFLHQSTDVKDQHKTKGKRLKINKLKVPFRLVLTENVSACTDWKRQWGFRGQRLLGEYSI